MRPDKLEISGISPEVLRALTERAQRHGKTPAVYVRELIEADILATRSFSEILAPVREDFRQSRMSEDEFDDLVDEERQALWNEKHSQ
jgi:predicted DNA-binding protein